MKKSSEAAFLEKLQTQAQLQARLSTRPFLPAQLDLVTSCIGQYPWQVLLVVSALTSLVIELVTRM